MLPSVRTTKLERRADSAGSGWTGGGAVRATMNLHHGMMLMPQFAWGGGSTAGRDECPANRMRHKRRPPVVFAGSTTRCSLLKSFRETCGWAVDYRGMAGAGGFEPPYGGIKIRCLTTWLRPSRKGADLSRCRRFGQCLGMSDAWRSRATRSCLLPSQPLKYKAAPVLKPECSAAW